ncbi:MAG: mechanosensitive ion channel family protein [Burkholderiales bacterium]
MRRLILMVLISALSGGTLSALAVRDARAASTEKPESKAPSTPPGKLHDIDAAEVERAAVTLDGKLLFKVRGIPAYPAEERATVIRQRIEAIAADPSVDIDSLHIVELEDRTRVAAGEHLVVGIIDADASGDGVSRKIMAQEVLKKVGVAIAAYRHARSPRVLLTNTGYALGATVLLALLLFVTLRVARWLDGILESRLRSRIDALEAQSHRILQARHLETALRGIGVGLRLLVMLVISYLYLYFVLSLFPWTQSLAPQLLAIFLDPLRSMATGLIESLPGLVFIVVVVIVMGYFLGVTRLYFEGIDRGDVTLAGFERDWALPTYKIVRLFVFVITVVVCYPYIPGSSSEAFKGVSILIGLMLSLGSSSVIGNVMAGYSMIYRRAFRVGDRIHVNDVTGDVVEKRLMVTHLRTIKNEEIVVPNSTMINSNIINYSTLARTDGLILHTTVGIGYETPWRQVEAMLVMAAGRVPELLKEPAPFVRQKSLGDFAVTYELNAYCDNAQAMSQLYTAMHQNVLDVFNEHGVQIMTPAYEGDPAKPKVVPKDQWHQAPATQVPPGAPRKP